MRSLLLANDGLTSSHGNWEDRENLNLDPGVLYNDYKWSPESVLEWF